MEFTAIEKYKKQVSVIKSVNGPEKKSTHVEALYKNDENDLVASYYRFLSDDPAKRAVLEPNIKLYKIYQADSYTARQEAYAARDFEVTSEEGTSFTWGDDGSDFANKLFVFYGQVVADKNGKVSVGAVSKFDQDQLETARAFNDFAVKEITPRDYAD